MKQFDAIIIGFGKGGKTLTAELAKRGWKVALIERSAMMYGGTCPNIACIPTKRLIHEAEKVSWLNLNSYEQKAEAYKAAITRKNEMTAESRASMFNKLNSLPNVTIYTGMASFVSPTVVNVTLPTGDIALEGKHIFINTGSTSIVPAINGLKESKKVYTSTSLMELEVLPRHLVVIGAGYIGLEFASMYARFGSKVTMLEGGDRFIPREDRDIANAVKESIEKRGIEIRFNARAQSIQDTADGVTVTYNDAVNEAPSSITGDAVLIAIGRKPMTQGLNLHAAGIPLDEHGAIAVNSYLRTPIPNIWALGDVKGGPQFTYISLDDYRIIRDQLFGNQQRTTDDRNPIAYSVFIDPPLSHVGLTEEEAVKRGHSIKVSRLSPATLPRARTLQQTDGLMKAIIDEHSGRIMGCTLFCAESSEVINLVNAAMKTGQHYSFLRDFIFTHPSMSEGLNDLFAID